MDRKPRDSESAMANKKRKSLYGRSTLRESPGAVGGDEEHLSGVDAIRVADIRIDASDARGVGSMTELGQCDLGERVACPHGELGAGLTRRDRGGQNNLGTRYDVIRIENAGIGDGQFMPAESATKVSLGEFPERVAAL